MFQRFNSRIVGFEYNGRNSLHNGRAGWNNAVRSAGIAPSFILYLIASLLGYASGDGTPTFTRATAAAHTDFEGIVRQVLAGAFRPQGARYVRNFLLATETLTSGWTSVTVTLAGGATDPSDGATAFSLTATGAASSFKTTPSVASVGSNISVRSSVFIRRKTGTGTVSLVNPNNTTTDITAIISSSWQRIALGVLVSGGTDYWYGFVIATSGDAIEVWHPMAEVVTGQSNTNPSEYVPALATANADSGAIGVRYFPYLNGNTVASNVVTEAQGPAIDSTQAACAGGVTAGVVDAAGPLGYLSEGVRTNLALQSQTLNTTWAVSNAADMEAVVADQYVAPDGTTTMDKLQTKATNAQHNLGQTLIIAGAIQYTYSYYLKYINNQWALLGAYDGTSVFKATFDLQNGVVGNVSAGTTSTITPTAIAGVYRVSMTFTTAVGGISGIYVAPTNAATSTQFTVWNAAGTELLGAWGAQLEAASFASSYIPTTTVAVQRNADVLTYPSAGNISGTVGSVYAEITGNNSANAWIVGDANAGFYSTAQKLTLFDGTENRAGNAVTLSAAPQKVASSWGGSASQTFLSGAASAVLGFDGNMNFAANFGVGSNESSGQLNGTIRNVRIYPQVLSAAKLQAMTTP